MEKGSLLEYDDRIYGHMNLLNETDLAEYHKLRRKFLTEVANSKRGEKVDVFTQRIHQIKEYVVKNDQDDWRRSFATGVIYLKDSIAINIKQLIHLLGKCKSSINGSLHHLGYVARPASKESDDELVVTIPYFNQNRRELKRWTIRQKRSSRRRSTKVVPLFGEEAPSSSPILECVSSAENELESLIATPSLTKKEIWDRVKNTIPCPAKFRHKYYSSILQSVTLPINDIVA